MEPVTVTSNARIVEAWNTILFDKFCRYEDVLVNGLGQHGTRLFEQVPPPKGGRILDIGCGFGDTTVQLAALVGEGGRVVGVDCAPNFIVASQKRAASRAAPRATFTCADVQTDDLDGPYDAAYSRFGTMFFTSPVAALRNIQRALAPGATFSMSVWRKRQDNPCFYVAQQVVERFIEEQDKSSDEVTCGPGPFSMAGADMLSDQLLAAGFTDLTFSRFDAPMCIGRSLDEALSFARDIGPAGESIRLATEKAAHLRGEIEEALRVAFVPLLRDDGVWAFSSTWLVTAKAAP